MSRKEKVKKQYKTMKTGLVLKVEINKLFAGQHNAGVWFQRVLTRSFLKKYQFQPLEYPDVLAKKELNLTQRQLTYCKNYLRNEGWITTKQGGTGNKNMEIKIHWTKVLEEFSKII